MMDTTAFRAAFPRQLRYWTLHCLLNALPSLGIALLFLELWKCPSAVAAMLSAIATFILLYSALTSLPGPLAESQHLLSRSLRLGTWIRAWISGTSMLLLPMGLLILFTPDYWCGEMAIGIVNLAARMSGFDSPVFRSDPDNVTSAFVPVYLVTLVEGFLLSFLLLMISFFALIFVQARDRRKAYAS